MPINATPQRTAGDARRHERELREQWAAAQAETGQWSIRSEGDRRILAQALVLTARGWRLLVDRRDRSTTADRTRIVLVGPSGVFVIDVAGPSGAADSPENPLAAAATSGQDLTGLVSRARLIERTVESLGLSPVAVRAVLAFPGRQLDHSAGEVRLLGEPDFGPALVAGRNIVRPAMVRALADHITTALPSYQEAVLPSSAESQPQGGTPDGTKTAPAPDGLFGVEGLRGAALDAALRAPIERWMTFLHPNQVALVRRDWRGPARISGPAGTGKTVVGLHRAAYLARRTTGRVLVVTHARNLPRVQRTFLHTMSPAVCDRIDFNNLHAWAQDFLRERGIPFALDTGKVGDAFARAWTAVGRDTVLSDIDPTQQYWRDEIDCVIKGRGVTDFDKYAVLPRRRRMTTLRRAHRVAVWALYEEYERNRIARGVHDFNDLLTLAIAEFTRQPGQSGYAAVIVDEVQDLTLVGLRLLHRLVGDVPNGLLLIGDGQQAVYPGGFRLSDAGLDIRGDRAQSLRVNYRNAKEILETALALVADDSFEDLDGTRTPGRRDVDLTFQEGSVLRTVAPDLNSHDQALLAALRARAEVDATSSDSSDEPTGSTSPWGDQAVLCPSKGMIAHYERLLTRAGIPLCPLERYDGRPVNAVKLGTYTRAKGLEFKHVHLPQFTGTPTSASPVEQGHDAARERQSIARNQLFVAMTRARDTLWLGSIARN
jgi:hypothetical protein